MTSESYRVLVVEDDPVSRLVLSRILTRLGHQVDAAPDVATALTQTIALQPDLVFSDFELPDGTGDDLLVAIRGADLRMPFVLVTGVAELDRSCSTADCGSAADQPTVAATLTKPVDSRGVSACLRAVLEPRPVR